MKFQKITFGRTISTIFGLAITYLIYSLGNSLIEFNQVNIALLIIGSLYLIIQSTYKGIKKIKLNNFRKILHFVSFSFGILIIFIIQLIAFIGYYERTSLLFGNVIRIASLISLVEIIEDWIK